MSPRAAWAVAVPSSRSSSVPLALARAHVVPAGRGAHAARPSLAPDPRELRGRARRRRPSRAPSRTALLVARRDHGARARARRARRVRRSRGSACAVARVLLAAALAVSMFPPIATVGPLYVALRAVRLLDTLPGLVLPYTTLRPAARALAPHRARSAQIPDELYRAARVDGCTPLGAFRRVLLPLAAPGVATAGLLVFIFAWNEFLYALTFISSPGAPHRAGRDRALRRRVHAEPSGQIAAASAIATLPLVVARAPLPAPDRLGAHRRRGEGVSVAVPSRARPAHEVVRRRSSRAPRRRPSRSRTASSSRSSARPAAASPPLLYARRRPRAPDLGRHPHRRPRSERALARASATSRWCSRATRSTRT